MLKEIRVAGSDPVVLFAADELAKYLGRMTGKELSCCQTGSKAACSSGEGLSIGLLGHFGLTGSVQDMRLDDEVHVAVESGRGIIAGVNARSVLLAVYRFLTEAGCRWVRPGTDGEFIPAVQLDNLTVQLHEKASYRHRGICIEGAVSYENVADMIDWLPKVGFNAYFFQFREAFTFFNRWYSHQGNPTLQPEPFTVEQCREIVKKLELEIEKRGLLYHAVGHGWTCEPFGIGGLGWDKTEQQVPLEVAKYLAEVKGKRDFWGGVALNTNLCYSNPEVRRIMIEDIAKYLEEHRSVDLLHFWLADGFNNQCECDNCRKRIPSDFYVRMLNELDALLTARGLDAKIVFLIYLDLMWAPEIEKIQNPDRYVLMFAPITRTYTDTFEVRNRLPELPKYVRNKLVFPTSIEENVVFLKEWQKLFGGDSFDFDYHFMWDHYIDPGYCRIAEVLGRDIKNLRNLGLDGLISCQAQRVFFPTGLGMYVMGRTLWNDRLSYEELADEYFAGAFGSDGLWCREYLEELSRLFDMEYMKGEKPFVSEESVERFGKIPPVINRFRPVIGKNLQAANPCHQKSWEYLNYHADLAYLLALALQASAADNVGMLQILWGAAVSLAQKIEPAVQPVLDVLEFTGIIGDKIRWLTERKTFVLTPTVEE